MKYDKNSLSFKEKRKFQIISNVVEGKLSIDRAATMLDYDKYYVKKLIQEYIDSGIESLVHKSKGLPSRNKANLELKDLIVDLYKKYYYGFNFTHFWKTFRRSQYQNPLYYLQTLFKLADIKLQIHRSKSRKIFIH